MSQEDKRKKVAKDKFLTGASIASIADGLGVSRRTIERWADEGAWREQRTADKVVSFSKPLQAEPESTHDRPRRSRPYRERKQIDEVEIIEEAIDSLSFLLTGMSAGPDEDDNGRIRPIDTRGIGSVAGALVKLLEYRRKINPPTVAALAEMAIELGMTPAEFMEALRDAWRLRA